MQILKVIFKKLFQIVEWLHIFWIRIPHASRQLMGQPLFFFLCVVVVVALVSWPTENYSHWPKEKEKKKKKRKKKKKHCPGNNTHNPQTNKRKGRGVERKQEKPLASGILRLFFVVYVFLGLSLFLMCGRLLCFRHAGRDARSRPFFFSFSSLVYYRNNNNKLLLLPYFLTSLGEWR